MSIDIYKMYLLLVVTISVLLHRFGYCEYETSIAVYITSDPLPPSNLSCFNGTQQQYSIDDLPATNLSNGTLLKFCSHQIVLNKNLSFSNLSQIGMIGHESTVLTCLDGPDIVGIEFTNIHGLELINITIEGCGKFASVDQSNPYRNIKASVIVQNSVDITFLNVAIRDSPGTGLALFYNSGSVKIYSSIFERNGLDRATGGNGVYVETGPSPQVVSVHSSHYEFEDCYFNNNSAMTGKDSKIKGFSRFDKGGGMCVYIRGSEHVNLNVLASLFSGNQAEKYGGGLFIAYNGRCSHNSATVSHTMLHNNTAKYGGAIYSGYLHDRRPTHVTPQNSSFIYSSLNFTENSAEFGGGVSIFSTKTPNQNANNGVRFENCNWTNNSGHYGAAIVILPNAWNINTPGYLPTPVLVDISISNNFVTRKTVLNAGTYYTEYSKGSGAFYCFNHRLYFEGESLFESNIGTALFLDSCVSVFKKNSVTCFKNNTGYQGGAIFELSSVIFVSDNSSMLFIENRAEDKGGAIFEHTSSMLIYDYSKTCFFDYSGNFPSVANRNVLVSFTNNYAAGYGHSIYASSLVPCYNRFSFEASNLSADLFNQVVGNFTYSPADRFKELATSANHSIVTENWTGRLSFVPGKQMTLPFTDIDDFGQEVQTNYLVTIHNQGNSNVSTNQYYSEISSNTLLLFGDGYDKAVVTLSDVSPRQNAISFEVSMEPCPPGFILDKLSHDCICSFQTANSYVGIDNCNLTLGQAYSKEGYWFGYINNETESESTLISGYCPRGFCLAGERTLLPARAEREELNSIMCSESRQGNLCGRCSENSSVYYHSTEFSCKSDSLCYLGWLFYILSEIVPVTIVFLLIIFLNIAFTSGLVNGFIFYCQVIEIVRLLSSDLIHSSTPIRQVNNIFTLIYSTFSLDFFVHDGLSFCFWKTAKAIDIIAIKYVTLLYAFCLIILVTVLLKKCTMRCSRFHYLSCFTKYVYFNGSIIHGLSAFFILCYAQCARSSVLLLTNVNVYRKGLTKYGTFVYYDGEIEWMSTAHLPYALPAIFFCFFVLVLPPILLLMYPLHNKVLSLFRLSEVKCIQYVFRPLDNLKPLFDSFQGCFKDEFRFFSGLYFVYRFFIMFNVVYNFLEDSFFFLEIQLLIMLVFHSICQPYKKRIHNVIDTLLFGNLAVIVAITYYNLNNSLLTPATSVDFTVLSVINCLLIILPVLVAICILAYVFYVKCWQARTKKSHSERTGIIDLDDDEFPDRGMYESFEQF